MNERKKTYYLDQITISKINDLFIHQLKRESRGSRSKIIREAIDMLHKERIDNSNLH